MNVVIRVLWWENPCRMTFDPNTPIVILDENRKIIDENIVGEVTQKIMNQREVISASLEKDKLVVITIIGSEQ